MLEKNGEIERMGKETAVEQSAVGQIAYSEYVNPQWARLLTLLQMNADYVECRGEMLVENFNVEADRFFAGEGVKVAADGVDLTGDTLG